MFVLQVLAAAERRHARSVRELEQERKRRAHDAAQGDDVCMMLEKERERLKQEVSRVSYFFRNARNFATK